MRAIFHLSIPVPDLDEAKKFYVNILGATIGREEEDWIDVLMWGHQVTLQRRPQDVLPRTAQGKRHFGAVLPWSEWEQLVDRLPVDADYVLAAPVISRQGTPREQAKIYLQDPGNNAIEIKAYRQPATVLGLDDAGYQ